MTLKTSLERGLALMPIDLEPFPAINNHQLGFDDKAVERFLGADPKDEAGSRLERLSRWMQASNLLNQYGVLLTPLLIEHLSQPDDLDGILGDLDRRTAETRRGRFVLQDPIQRDLEFRRFAAERTGVRMPIATDELYHEFVTLGELPAPRQYGFSLSGEQMLAARRVAHEAVGF
jgi:hypothetical protein